MKSKTRRRVIALVLCMVMLLSCGVTTLAEGNTAEPAVTGETAAQENVSAEAQTDTAADDAAVVSESQEKMAAAETAETETEETASSDVAVQSETADTEGTERAQTEESTAADTTEQTAGTESGDAAVQSEEETTAGNDTAETSEPETSTENETQADTAEKTEKAAQLYSEKYEDDTIKISVSAEAGIVPEGAKLSVTPIEKTEITDDMTAEEKAEAEKINDQYDLTEKKLNEDSEENEETMEGFLAYDISFLVNGEEVEPSGDVNVVMEFKEAAIPEGVSEDAAVTVKHLKEDETAEDGVVVEDMADKAEVKATEKAEVEKVELTANSFSTFTISWTTGYGIFATNLFDITAHYVYLDENGNKVEITDYTPKNDTIELGEDGTYDLSEYAVNNINGYNYLKTTVGNTDTEITTLTTSSVTTGYGWDRTTTYYVKYIEKNTNQEQNWLETARDSDNNPVTGDIYFVYEQVDLQIVDDIINSGALQADYTGDQQVLSYQWYRCETENGQYIPVEKIDFQGGNSNISESGSSLYPAYDKVDINNENSDNGARKWYKVVATLSNDTEVESAPYQVPYYNELQNGSFEVPKVPEGSNMQYGNVEYANAGGVWQSTGEIYGDYHKKDVALEIIQEGENGGDVDYNWYEQGDRTWNDAAPEGAQFAELNCEAAGALYQDVLTASGTQLNYWLSHRARGDNKNNTDGRPEYDTMYLVIMPTSVAVDEELNTQSKLEEYLHALNPQEITFDDNGSRVAEKVVYNQEGILVIKIASNDESWHEISNDILGGVKYVPTSSLTRFFFVAGKTDAPANKRSEYTQGNFLDDVGFSQKLPPVRDDEFSFELNKNFEGIYDNTTLTTLQEQIGFDISVKEGDRDLSDDEIIKLFTTTSIVELAQTPEGNLVWTLTNQKIGVDKSYEVTITEKNADLPGYSLETKTSVTSQVRGEEPSTVEGTGQSVTFSLTGKTTYYVTFTNSYSHSESKDINFTKVWDDVDNAYGTRPETLNVTLEASISYEENGEIVTQKLTSKELPGIEFTKTLRGEDTEDWTTKWEGVPVYYDHNGTLVKIDYSVVEGDIESGYVYEAVDDDGKALVGNGSDYKKTDFGTLTEPTNSTSNSNTEQEVANQAATMSVADNAEDELGQPLHNKYIEYNETTGEYTLNLDVTGAKGEAKGADILFVIDTSGSMAGRLMSSVKNLLANDENNIIDQILGSEGNVNSVAYVSFAGMSETRTSRWYSGNDSDIATLKSRINSLRATGGTNWTYAMQMADRLLAQRSNSDNEKVVIFLSDGEPTYSMGDTWWGYGEIGSGSSTKDSYYDDAVNEVKNSETLMAAQIYSVYLTNGTRDGMEKFAKALGNAELVNGADDLSSALSGILNQVIPTYKNVTITDTLSEWVEFVEENPTVKITKKAADGTETVLSEASVAPNGKMITVPLLDGASLDDGATYTISFKIKPTDETNNYFVEHNYPDTGEAGTGITSAGKDGFYSNDDAGTKLTYTVGDDPTQKTASYPMPVVQVTSHTLTYEKIWEYPESEEVPSEEVTIRVTYTDGTTKDITLSSPDYKFSETVPVTKSILSVVELDPNPDYTPSYKVENGGTKATVINSYSKITAISIDVQKIWEGEGPKAEIEVALYQSIDGEDAKQFGDTKTLNVDNNWKSGWEDLPQTVGNGEDVKTCTYAVREISIPEHYTSSISYDYGELGEGKATATITNTYDPNCADEDFYIANVLQTDKLTVNKYWDDNNDLLKFRPENGLPVTISDGQGNNYNVTLMAENWNTEITVPRVKNATYSAVETVPEHYKQQDYGVYQTSNGATIYFENALESTQITVKKNWVDTGIDLNTRPTSITFKLEYRKNDTSAWEDYRSYTMTEENQGIENVPWSIVITGLPASYEYQVVEVSVTGADNEPNTAYDSVVTQTEDGGNTVFTITNTLKWSAVKQNKKLAEGQEITGLEGATFELKNASGDVIASGTSGKDGAITWTETTEDLYKLNGSYTIVETKAPAGYVINSAGWQLNFENGLLTSCTNGAASVAITKDGINGIVIPLENEMLYELPEAGGSGIYWYMLGGVLLMMAGSLLVYKKRRGEVLRRK